VDRGPAAGRALAARDPRPRGARPARLLDRGPAAANRPVPDCVAQAAVGITQEEGNFGPVRSTFALRAIRIRSRVAISNLSGHAAQAAGLADGLEGHVVRGCVQPGDRLAGGGPGGEADLAPDNPLFSGDDPEVDRPRQAEGSIATGDTGGEAV
jgi:hypothetical protein